MAQPATQVADQSLQIVARLERLPASPWHVRARLIIGTATFFDAFDALSISYVLPVLVPLWALNPTQTGLVISLGYVGQLIGAIIFGRMAEKRGRLPALMGTIVILSAFSVACAFAWNYWSLLVFRFFQGIGLGGEVPIAAAYINELTRAKGRGRFVLLYELLFSIGSALASVAGYFLVQTVGWRWMFVLGAVPAFVAMFMRRILPESPRWLASVGRVKEADEIVSNLETIVSKELKTELPPPKPVAAQVVKKVSDWRELFRGIYFKRTLVIWVIWFTAYLVVYGTTTWAPTLFRTVYHQSLEVSLRYSLYINLISLVASFLCALLIDNTGRKIWFTLAFILGGLALVPIWATGAKDVITVLVWLTAARAITGTVSLALYLYSPEIYPTRLRALGSSLGSAWLRVASIIGPYLVGYFVSGSAVGIAFLVFGIVSVIGGIIVGLFAVETKGKVLEEISP